MNYEQRYKEDLKAVNELQDANPTDEGIKNWVNDNVSELQESEDERIRKIITLCLEECVHSDIIRDYEKDECRAWLEKKVEQKSFDYKNATIVPKDFAPKIEPKFQNGQWIVWQNKCYKVNYNGCGYELIDQNGLRTSLEYGTVDENAHLWTIEDAKDGDVLFAENFDNIGGCVFLFKGLDSWKFDAEGDKAVSTGYCCASITESGSTDFGIQGPDCVEIKRVHPATKEQRDLLFYKMKESGYEWDAEKKELKLLINNLWKPADGDYLPEINREVVVFIQNFPEDAGIMKVAIAHRPNPNGWDGRSILTGEVGHYTPKTYDKGGWNQPGVKWWLDLDLPKMQE